MSKSKYYLEKRRDNIWSTHQSCDRKDPGFSRGNLSEVSQKIVDTVFQSPYTVPAGELHLKYFIQPDKY
jgi:hypothetical protein